MKSSLRVKGCGAIGLPLNCLAEMSAPGGHPMQFSNRSNGDEPAQLMPIVGRIVVARDVDDFDFEHHLRRRYIGERQEVARRLDDVGRARHQQRVGAGVDRERRRRDHRRQLFGQVDGVRVFDRERDRLRRHLAGLSELRRQIRRRADDIDVADLPVVQTVRPDDQIQSLLQRNVVQVDRGRPFDVLRGDDVLSALSREDLEDVDEIRVLGVKRDRAAAAGTIAIAHRTRRLTAHVLMLRGRAHGRSGRVGVRRVTRAVDGHLAIVLAAGQPWVLRRSRRGGRRVGHDRGLHRRLHDWLHDWFRCGDDRRFGRGGDSNCRRRRRCVTSRRVRRRHRSRRRGACRRHRLRRRKRERDLLRRQAQRHRSIPVAGLEIVRRNALRFHDDPHDRGR